MPVSEPSSRSSALHHFFWWGGIFLALAPYLILNVNPAWRAPWILGPGHFADNIIIAARHLLIGATLGGWLYFLTAGGGLLRRIGSWWHRPSRLNWIWFALSLLIYAFHNVLVLFSLPIAGMELLASCLGRILTAVIVLSILWLVAHIASDAAPRRFRHFPWVIPALLPGILGADAVGIILWKNSLRSLANRMDEEGSLNIARQLNAGGLEQSPAELFFYIALGASALIAACYLAARMSQTVTPRARFRPRVAIYTLAGIWLGLAVEQASGFAWKSRKAQRLAHNSYQVHLTPLHPSPGVASFSASWHSGLPEEGPLPERPKLQERPDIFLIFLESTRLDAIAPEHTPFLAEFQQECQPLGDTWSASNGTHLSWFSIFNGQLPPWWNRAMEDIRTYDSRPLSPLLRTLEDIGYHTEISTVCDLGYNGMSTTNFGHPAQVDILRQALPGSPEDALTIPEREVAVLAQAKASLLAAPSEGNFHLLGLYSPHFGYSWHSDFEPPYENLDSVAHFHAYPTEEDVEKVRNRYLNALAWTDHLVADFIAFLKEQGRYEDALIIITGDHGEEFHEHGSWFHCSSLEQEQTRVPLFIKYPAGVAAPAHPSASHLDILPTLLSLLSLEDQVLEPLPGQNLLAEAQDTRTQVSLTPFTGLSGIAMAWRRNGYTATFRWENPWATDLPEQIHLDDITAPDGSSLDLQTQKDWAQQLHRLFPDAPERLFSHWRFIN